MWDSKMVCKAASQLSKLMRERLDSITTVVILMNQKHPGSVSMNVGLVGLELIVVTIFTINLTGVPTVPTQFHPKNLTSSTRPLT